jgi:hypothetical protein
VHASLPNQMHDPRFVQELEDVYNAVVACRGETAQHLPLQEMTPRERVYARAVLERVAAFVAFLRERVLVQEDGPGA